MLLSAIICTCDRQESLRQTLATLVAADVPEGCEVEIIVADNGREALRLDAEGLEGRARSSIRVIRVEPRGKSHAANAALATARGQVLLFVDDDIRVPQNWLVEMSRAINEGRLDAVTGPVELPPSRRRPWMSDEHVRWLGCCGFENVDPESVSLLGGNMAFSRRVLETIRGFDNDLGPGGIGHEDAMFTIRLRDAGFRIGIERGAPVQHQFPLSKLTREGFIESMRRSGEFGAYVARRRGERWNHPRLRLMKAAIDLHWARLRHWRQWRKHPAMPEWEMPLLMRYFARKHYLRVHREKRESIAAPSLPSAGVPEEGNISGNLSQR